MLIDVPYEMIEKRMTGRRVCLRCGATYHVEANPPRIAGVCDICGDKLVIRSDDQPEVVKRRHETYRAQTEPLVGYYEKQGKLKRIDGTQGIRCLLYTSNFYSHPSRCLWMGHRRCKEKWEANRSIRKLTHSDCCTTPKLLEKESIYADH